MVDANKTSKDDGFERIMTMEPAFDKRHPNPSKNYGIHGVNLRMVLKGPLGATQFLLYTNWMLPHVTEELVTKYSGHLSDRIGLKCAFLPMPADLGYHWTAPQYEGQEARECDLLPGGKCYYDGSGLNAEPVFEKLLTAGSEGVWRELEDYYKDMSERQAETGTVTEENSNASR